MTADDMPPVRRNMLDELFTSFSLVADGTYTYVCDMKYDVSRWSRSAVERFGLPGEYMAQAGDLWEERLHPDDRQVFHDSCVALFNGTDTTHDMQYRARTVTGDYVACTCRGIVMHDAEGNLSYFAGSIREHGLTGNVDATTGLQNQYRYFKDLQRLIDQHQHAVLLTVGFAHFSTVNNLYGYAFGNRVMQTFAHSLLVNARDRGYVYRLDGTKFAIILPDFDIGYAKMIYTQAQRYLNGGAFKVDGHPMNLTLAGGALTLDSFDVSAQTVFSCLDYAYHSSRHEHEGDLVVFDEDDFAASDDHMRMIDKIRSCISDGCRGFELHYQPFVDAESEQPVGAEALLRWRDPDYGLVYPGAFMPLIENDVLFPTLGVWILGRALTQMRPYVEAHPGFTLNVNIAYAQLKHSDFIGDVLDLLDKTGFPATSLQLELTERCRVADPRLLRALVNQLHEAGVSVALDDFGTGYASGELLQRIEFDTVKLDYGLVKDVATVPNARIFVSHTIDMARELGSNVCVEGVETTQTRDILRANRPTVFQGFLYSRPIPAEDLFATYA